MKIGIIVLAHRSPTQLAFLLSQLSHSRVELYLHLDRKAPLDPFQREIRARSVENLSMLPRKRTRWGGIEMVDATLDGMRRGLSDGCDYFFLISGQDFPLDVAVGLLDFAREAGERSYMEYFPFPAEHWRYQGRIRTEFYTYTVFGRRETCIPRGEPAHFSLKGRMLNEALRLRNHFKPPRRFPDYLEPFGGSQWWNLSRVAAQYVVGFLEDHPDYRLYHEHTLIPDEIFFQSILLGSRFSESHEVVNDSLRFTVWEKGSSHPNTLSMGDISDIRGSGGLFARKVDLEFD